MALAECLALLGEKEQALEIIDKIWVIRPFEQDTWWGTLLERSQMQVHIILGQYEEAWNKAQFLLAVPSNFSLPQLQNHPLYAPLRELEAYKRMYGNQ